MVIFSLIFLAPFALMAAVSTAAVPALVIAGAVTGGIWLLRWVEVMQ